MTRECLNAKKAAITKKILYNRSRLSREAIYIRRQPSSLTRDRGTLPDVYDHLI